MENSLQYNPPAKECFIERINGCFNSLRPRIMTSRADIDTIKVKLGDECSFTAYAHRQMISRCDKLMELAPRDYDIPDRLRLLKVSRAVLNRVEELSMCYLLSGCEKYARRAWDELSNAASFKDWNAYRHFLDAAEMGAAFAIGYDWLHGYLDEEQKQIMRNAMMNYAIIPAYNAHFQIPVEGSREGNDFWVTNEYNWNAVCNGGISIAALSIIDDLTCHKDREICFSLIHASAHSLKYLAKSFYPDGAWVEGPSYWGYTINYLARLLSTYEICFDTDFGWSHIQGFNNTGESIIHMEGYTGINNFHDAAMGPLDSWQLFWLARKLNKPNLGACRIASMRRNGFHATLFDLLWHDDSFELTDVVLPLDSKFAVVDYLSLRSSWSDPMGMFLSTHGGATTVPHHHVDSGSFVLDCMGVRWAVDLGPESYSHSSLLNERYRFRAESHNTLVINPDDTAGQEADAYTPIEKFQSTSECGFGILNMTECYRNIAISVRRGLKLEDNRRSAVVRDEVITKEQADVYWFMTTGETVMLEDKRIILVNESGVKMQMDYLSNVPLEIGVTDATPLATSPNPDGQTKNTGYQRIFIKATVNGAYELTVKFMPFDQAEGCVPLRNTPLEQWSLQLRKKEKTHET